LKSEESSASPNQPAGSSSRGLELGKATAEGATSLFFSKLAQQLVGLIGGVILIRLLISPAVYAYITLATTVPGLVMLGNFTGVNAGLSKYLSLYKVEKDSNSIWSSFWSAIFIKLVTGATLSFVAYFAAGPISTLVGKPLVDPYFKLASPLPIVWTMQISIKSTMISLGRVRIYSVYQIVDEILISSFPIIAVVLGYGAIGALAAMVVANFVSWGIAMSLTVSTVFGATEKGQRKLKFIPSARRLMKFGLPLGIANSFGTFSGQAVNLIIARFVSLDIYGLYSVASTASGLASYISDPISSMLLPVFSRIKGSQEGELFQTAFRETIRYAALFYLPVGLFLTVFARPLVILLFGYSYANAGFFLSILAGFGLAYGLGSQTISSVLTSQGYSKFIGSMSVLFQAVSIGLAALIIPTIGFVPFLFAGIVTIPSGYLIQVNKLKKAANLSPPLYDILPMYVAAALAGLVSISVLLLQVDVIAQLVIAALVMLTSYILFNLIFSSITFADVNHVRWMLSNQRLLLTIVSPFLSAMEYIAVRIHAES
jgi:O-antigen/teichoic acid export membrane protein